ncbi:DUF11 domain-containing protein [Kangiella sp. HD9-110m-PIT-SAG07]|nr:DUF11 domain-containing protein [Kangiella sp. HD9-110m-PIT-SAG07]
MMKKKSCATCIDENNATRNKVLLSRKTNSYLGVWVLTAGLFIATNAQAEEPYTVDIDGTDTWSGSNVTNFLDVDSTISTEASGLQLQVNSTLGTQNGSSSYSANNANGDEEVNLNIANQKGQRAEIIWTFSSSVFPLGANNPSFNLRDVDSNTSGFLEDPPGASNEFCDRIEVRAFDIDGNTVSASNFSVSTATAPTTFAAIPASAGTPANSFVIEGNANDTAGNSEAQISIAASSIRSIRVIYEECETPDTDRPGAIGIVNGFGAFSVFTTDLAVNKQWQNAATGDQATVNVTGGTVTTLPSLNSTADSANETDSGTAREVISGVDYTISETLDAGNTFSYVNSLSCTGSGDGDVTDGVLTPTASDTSVTCTYLNRLPEADISVTKSDGDLQFEPGKTVTYQIVITNNGPESADGLLVSDALPAGLESVTWSCRANAGAVCANASGSGDVAETIPTLPNGGSVTFRVTGTYSTDPSGY